MIASLNQSGSSVGRAESSSMRAMASQVVVEIPLAADAAADREDLRGHLPGIELHVIAGPVPQITPAAEQVVHLERTIGRELERLAVELHPARLAMVRI